MKTYIVTLVGWDGPMKSEFALGFNSQDVYDMYRNEYPVQDYPQIQYIDVSQVLNR